MSIAETKIYPINTGWLETDQGTYIFWKGAAGEKMWIPVICYLVDTGEHKILVDTGLPDEERATKYHHKCESRGCLESPEALRKLGVEPEEIDICIFTHLHWDHAHNMKAYTNARYICTQTEFTWAMNPLPLYYRSYESPILGIESPFSGCVFEFVEGDTEIVPGVSVFPTPGHCPGHQCVTVQTTAGDAVLVGDAFFRLENIEPNMKEHWRYWVPARFVNSIDGWKSIEEIDRRADYVLPAHDERILEFDVYPSPGIRIRKRREVIPGAPFFFTGIGTPPKSSY
ncbi:MAG: MBL fold metallo-hydrolase [Gammaproteobacteria bacterium]|jgi:glyoxylase-like metal-dependent hydrolase (beta-lactamase superfamily II)|nr:MAG: MBL fold metallo-hydrolase [Gammaproteobacteria bacterium]|tara:strand:- start:405 stop:1259 length:855 start_codon:yes stop_codon:yes gene_type:complete